MPAPDPHQSLRAAIDRASEENADALRERFSAARTEQWVESVPGLLVGETTDPPPPRVMTDQYRLDAPLSTEGRLLAALLRDMRALTAEVRGLRALLPMGAA
jgi:hypothetical protein